MEPAEGEELAVRPREHFVDVGQHDHEGDGAPVEFGQHVEFGLDDRLQLLGRIGNLVFCERHEAPIVRPGIVEDCEDLPDFFRPARLVDRADADALVALAGLDDALDKRREGPRDVEIVGQQALGMAIAGPLDPRLVVRRIVAHHDHRRMVVALDQQARFFPDRQRDRADDARHALVAQPCLRPCQQRMGDRLVLGVEIAEHARARAHALFGRKFQRQMVDMRPTGLPAR